MHARRTALGLGTAVLVAGATLALGTGVAFAGSTGGNTSADTTVRVTICHATGPYTYVVERPSELAVLNGQYATHQDARDIIPPFTHNGKHYAGRNWTAAGQAILKAGCVDVNAPKPKPKPQPKAKPTTVAVVSSDDETAEAAAADVVPTTSTHAGEYTGGWTGGQWAAAALAVSGAATTGGALLRRRLVQRG